MDPALPGEPAAVQQLMALGKVLKLLGFTTSGLTEQMMVSGQVSQLICVAEMTIAQGRRWKSHHHVS